MNLKAPSNTPIRSVTDEALRVYLDAGGERSITTSIITVYSSRRKEIKCEFSGSGTEVFIVNIKLNRKRLDFSIE